MIIESARRRTRARATLVLPLVFFLAAGCGSSDPDQADAAAEQAAASTGAESGAEAPPGMPPGAQEQMALMQELQAIDRALGPIREQAMQDPELREQQEALIQEVEAEMERIRPGAGDEQTRFDSLRSEFGAARQAGEQERVQALGAELQTLQTSLQETQRAALEDDEIAAAVEAFRENLREEMRATDPRADSLLDRADELSEELQATSQGGEGGGG